MPSKGWQAGCEGARRDVPERLGRAPLSLKSCPWKPSHPLGPGHRSSRPLWVPVGSGPMVGHISARFPGHHRCPFVRKSESGRARWTIGGPEFGS